MIIERYTDGTLADHWPSTAPRSPRGLDADERRLLALLRQRRVTARIAPAAAHAKAS
jgi:hypothetical protein